MAFCVCNLIIHYLSACYGFGNKIINWIKILYKKPKYYIVNNNFLSPFLIYNKV